MPIPGASCQIVRTLDVIGEKWSLLVIRESLKGTTRYSDFRDRLGAPTDVLSNRLGKLVDGGVLEKREYREPGGRARSSYHLTERGEALRVVIAAMIQWGDEYNPAPDGAVYRVANALDDRTLRLGYLDSDGTEVDPASVAIAPGPAARATWDYRR